MHNRSVQTRFFLSLMVIMGLIVAGISPFCMNNSSSKMLLEICSEFGIKTISVDVGGVPVNPDDQGQQQTKQKCPYCFVAQMAYAAPDIAAITEPVQIAYRSYIFSNIVSVVLSEQAQRYDARAPPAQSILS